MDCTVVRTTSVGTERVRVSRIHIGHHLASASTDQHQKLPLLTRHDRLAPLSTVMPSTMLSLQVLVQAESPKDQYLLLRALDEVLASLLTLPNGSARLREATGDQASTASIIYRCPGTTDKTLINAQSGADGATPRCYAPATRCK